MTGKMITTDVLVIGAGPAGLAAAAEAAAAGLDVTIADENARAGGQISRQRLPEGSRPGGAHDDPLVPAGVRFLAGSVCVGVGPGDGAVLARGGSLVTVRWRALLLATGAIEQVLPLPGWTTPGVMSAGAAQTMVKSSGRFPFERVVVAGSGPLLLAAAAQLVRAGARVEAVAEAHRFGPPDLRAVPRLVWGGRVLGEGASYLATLLRARVPLLTGHALREVVGTQGVEAVDLAPVERDWSFRPGAPARHVPCDAVVLSHGFSSNVELAVAAGARVVWDEVADTWRPWRDATFATTRSGVWAAGDCAGVSGAPVARAEGAVAGLAIAAALGADLAGARHRRALARRLSRLERFHAALEQWSRRQPGAASWRSADTVVCRCQETTAEEVEAAIATGAGSLSAIKLWTRAGMGRCQGRTCGPVLRAMLRERGDSPAGDEPPSIRFPVRPVAAGAVAGWAAAPSAQRPPLAPPASSSPNPDPSAEEAS